MYDFLMPFLSKKLDSQKLVAIIFIAQFISSSITLKPGMITLDSLSGLFDWIHSLIDILLANISDKSPWIRKHCFKGIGNISLLLKFSFKSLLISDSNAENIPDDKFSFSLELELTQTILEGLFAGMEDTSEFCAREALFSLQRLIQLLDSRIVTPNLLSLMMRLPDNFERSDPITRMGAFNLLGKMAGLITQENENCNRLIESLHFHIISLILHINDENPAVKQSCINSLNNLATLLDLQQLKSLIDSLSGDINKNQNFGSLFDKNEIFLLKTIEILAENFPGKLDKYVASLYGFCSSPDDNIKAIAGLLLCQCLVFDKHASVNENIIYKLCQLMEEKSQQVKAKMIKGLLLLSPLVKS